MLVVADDHHHGDVGGVEVWENFVCTKKKNHFAHINGLNLLLLLPVVDDLKPI